ncbi:hypothetical protein G7Y89_g2777 [Cudoniella acicularis]|uniref:Uncharacterized protein n=1 Tax=Cudoniella acicularis TaxID=354080 RepID=A0A8H4RSP1_9HELO|nr:hypothetical protein G7Y89_g2777 [Cudoniella acicularis]
MPFNELHRRDSWPPTILRIRDQNSTETFNISAIDENPFAFFLSSPDDIEDFLDDEDLSAGIETSVPKPVVREVSPSSLQRIPLPDDKAHSFGLEMPMTLKDFSIRHTSGRKSRAGDYKEAGVGLGISMPENAALRGRPRVKLSSERAGRGRGRARSLSARRTQSWREPSPDIWSIEEEKESDEENTQMVRNSGVKIVITPASSDDEAPIKASPSPKPKKRVHWAI